MKTLITLIAMLISTNGWTLTLTEDQRKVMQDIIWAADKAEVPRLLLVSICFGEGSFHKDKKLTHMDGNSFSHGTCQIKLSTARFMDEVYKHKYIATAKRLEIPKVNAFYAAKYLLYQLNRYDWNWKLAADAYNKHIAVSTRSKYVKRLLKNMKKLVDMKFLELRDSSYVGL